MYAVCFITRSESPAGKVSFTATHQEDLFIRQVLLRLLYSMLRKHGQATPYGPPQGVGGSGLV
jgi:hypothetical protein